VGLLVLAVGEWLKRRRDRQPAIAAAPKSSLFGWSLTGLFLVCFGLVGVVWLSGGLDKFVVLEAGKSLRYRLEWWTSVRQMLMSNGSYALLGVGPGNFRQHYLPFKLPASSEEIADPHNLLLDVWANGGLVGLAGLLLVILWTVRGTWRHIRFAGNDQAEADLKQNLAWGRTAGDSQPDNTQLGDWVRDPVVWIIALGCASPLLIQGDLEQLGGVALVAVGLAIIFHKFSWSIQTGVLTAAAAFVALGVHLLGAGGIGTPAISLLLLSLAAHCEMPFRDDNVAANEMVDPSWKFIAVLAVTMGLFLGGWWNVTTVLNSSNLIARGNDQLNKGQLQNAEQSYLGAEAVDRWSMEPIRKQVALAFEQYRRAERDNETLFRKATDLQQVVVNRDPHAYSAYVQMGDLYSRRFDRTRQPTVARTAAEWYARAIEHYPTWALLQVQSADAWSRGGESAKAHAAAQRALELHEINVLAGHPDKQLTPEAVQSMRTILTAKTSAAP